jgi:hypothetical protein
VDGKLGGGGGFNPVRTLGALVPIIRACLHHHRDEVVDVEQPQALVHVQLIVLMERVYLQVWGMPRSVNNDHPAA